MPNAVEPAPRATRAEGWRMQWDVGSYAFLIWSHDLPARLFLVLLCFMASFPSTWLAGTTVMVSLLVVVDAVVVTVRGREPSYARLEVRYALPLPVRRIAGYVEVAGVLALFAGMAWAFWAKPWWPARDPLSAAFVAVAGVGLVASFLRQARRVRLAGA